MALVVLVAVIIVVLIESYDRDGHNLWLAATQDILADGVDFGNKQATTLLSWNCVIINISMYM